MSINYYSDGSGNATFYYSGFADISSYQLIKTTLSGLVWTDLSGLLQYKVSYVAPAQYYFSSISGLFSGYNTISSSINLSVSGIYTNNFAFLTSSNYIEPTTSFLSISSYAFEWVQSYNWLSNSSYNLVKSFYLNGTLDSSGGDIIIRQGSLYVGNSINNLPVAYINGIPTLSSLIFLNNQNTNATDTYQNLFLKSLSGYVNSYYFDNGATDTYQNLFLKSLSGYVNSYYYDNGATDTYQSLYLKSLSGYVYSYYYGNGATNNYQNLFISTLSGLVNNNYYQIGALQNGGAGGSYLPLAGGTLAGLVKFSNNGNEMIDLGYGDGTREVSAGKIAYGPAYDTDAVTIVGKGTSSGTRKVHIYDNLTIENSLSITGTTTHSNKINLNNNTIYLRTSSDTNHYLKYESGYDGPKLCGYAGGCLSTTNGSIDALTWDVNKVQINNDLNVQGSIINSYNSLYLQSLSGYVNSYYYDNGATNNYQSLYLKSLSGYVNSYYYDNGAINNYQSLYLKGLSGTVNWHYYQIGALQNSMFLPLAGGTMTGDITLNDHVLKLHNDNNHYLKYDSGTDGAILAGWNGGILKATNPNTNVLQWSASNITTNTKMIITESTGTAPSATDGSLVIKHTNLYGWSSIVFPSSGNSSDFGYIRFSDYTKNLITGNGEDCRLIIGIENDANSGGGPDCIALMACGGVGAANGTGSVLINKLTPTGNTNNYSLDVYASANIDADLNVGGGITTTKATIYNINDDITANGYQSGGGTTLSVPLDAVYFFSDVTTVTLPVSNVPDGTRVLLRNNLTTTEYYSYIYTPSGVPLLGNNRGGVAYIVYKCFCEMIKYNNSWFQLSAS